MTEPLGLTQPTVSRRLKILVEAGIFTRGKRGVWAYYALVSSALDAHARRGGCISGPRNKLIRARIDGQPTRGPGPLGAGLDTP